jgi:hypothetical protein
MGSTTGTSPPVRSARRPPQGARRFGYALSAGINLALLWVVNISPGWGIVPFLTDDFARVVGVVNASLLVGVVSNLVYLAADPVWLRRLGDAITAAFALVVLLQLVTVFPFDLGTVWSGWETVLRTGLALACVGTGIGVIANLAQLLRALIETPEERAGSWPVDERRA